MGSAVGGRGDSVSGGLVCQRWWLWHWSPVPVVALVVGGLSHWHRRSLLTAVVLFCGGGGSGVLVHGMWQASVTLFECPLKNTLLCVGVSLL